MLPIPSDSSMKTVDISGANDPRREGLAVQGVGHRLSPNETRLQNLAQRNPAIFGLLAIRLRWIGENQTRQRQTSTL